MANVIGTKLNLVGVLCGTWGKGITPALFTRTSRRWDCEVNWRAASAMEVKEVRSRFRILISAEGTAALIS